MKKNQNNNSANGNNSASATPSVVKGSKIESTTGSEKNELAVIQNSAADKELASQQLEAAQKAKMAAEQKLNANNNIAKPANNSHIFLIIGGLFLTGSVLVIGYLFGKNKK